MHKIRYKTKEVKERKYNKLIKRVDLILSSIKTTSEEQGTLAEIIWKIKQSALWLRQNTSNGHFK